MKNGKKRILRENGRMVVETVPRPNGYDVEQWTPMAPGAKERSPISHKGNFEVDSLNLTIYFDEAPGDPEKNCRQSVTISLDPHGARDIAYCLLMAANDVEG